MAAPRGINTLDTNPSCGSVTVDIMKQVAPAVGNALANWLQGVLTVANITNCLKSTGEKLDDDFAGKRPNCGPVTSKPGNRNGSKLQFGHGGSKLADRGTPEAVKYVDYPTKFTMNAPGSGNPASAPTNWNLAKKTTVTERWNSQTNK